jgi:hypothetical protein
MSKKIHPFMRALMSARNVIAPYGPDDFKDYNPDFTSSYIRDLFGAFHLDPESRHDRDCLLAVCITALFGRGEAGRKPKWNLAQLMDDVGAVKNEPSRKKSDREICRILIEDRHGRFDGRYKDIGPEALRHKVRELNRWLGNN